MNNPTTPSGITIRRAETIADYLACQAAQRLAWGISDETYVVPVATMVGAQHHGGLVLGAFLPDGEAVGVSFAFLGRLDDGRACLYSQLTGVVPGRQGQGLGFLLKSAQREAARHANIPCLAWAFDPLQAGNARFNLDKLGATATRYIENMYGPRSDALNRGAPTDRLIAVWETEPPDRPGIDSPLAVIDVITDPDGTRTPSGVRLAMTAPALSLEIPDDINRLRRDRPDLAPRWTLAVRQAFLAAFAQGYRAEAFTGGESGSYLLRRSPT